MFVWLVSWAASELASEKTKTEEDFQTEIEIWEVSNRGCYISLWW